jgi:D-sedoheptulose 7-phosphate isomerase
MQNLISSYKDELINSIKLLSNTKIIELSKMLINVRSEGGTVFLVGNGGSAANPSHAAGDWLKSLKLRSICLTDNASALTAFANDTSYENIFYGQLKVMLSPGDIVIGFSGSGNSKNVIEGIKYANECGNVTVGITGDYKGLGGGDLAKIAKLSIVVETHSMEQIEDMHLIIIHLLKNSIISYDNE